MARERLGRLLIAVGLIAAVVSVLVVGATFLVRDGDVVERAGPALLEVPEVRSAVTLEFEAQIAAVYAPEPLAPETLAVASERMASNGEVVDDFVRALGEAHGRWLDGAPLQVDLEPRVVTEAAIAGLRDADLSLAERFPRSELLDPRPVPLAWDTTATWVRSLAGLGVVGILAGLAVAGVGAVTDPTRHRPVKAGARALVGAGLVIAVAALVLPLSALRSVDSGLAALGALLGTVTAPLLIVAAVLVFLGLWLHATADRLVRSVRRSIVSHKRETKEAAPVRTGAGQPARRRDTRRRQEAIDAFFDREVEVIDARDPEVRADEPAEYEPADHDSDGETDEPAALSAEEERARAAAEERRAALERIDGTRGGYRTHLPR